MAKISLWVCPNLTYLKLIQNTIFYLCSSKCYQILFVFVQILVVRGDQKVIYKRLYIQLAHVSFWIVKILQMYFQFDFRRWKFNHQLNLEYSSCPLEWNLLIFRRECSQFPTRQVVDLIKLISVGWQLPPTGNIPVT